MPQFMSKIHLHRFAAGEVAVPEIDNRTIAISSVVSGESYSRRRTTVNPVDLQSIADARSVDRFAGAI